MRKRILHILFSNKYSGAENIAINIIKGLNSKYDFAYTCPYGPIVEVLKKEGINYIQLEGMSLFKVRHIVQKWKPDIIHAHDFRASILSAFSLLSVPVISHLHNNPLWIKSLNLYSIIFYIASYKFTKILTVSNAFSDEYIFSRHIKNKIVVVHNAVDIEKVKSMAKKIENTEQYDLVFIGRLTEQKDPIRFIDIVTELHTKYPNITAAIIGDGEYRADCERHVYERGAEKYIKMYGFVQNPFAIIKNARIVVMPSKWEGFGLSAVEAMALGKPVLASPVGGLKEIIDNSCGRLCRTNEEFVDACIEFLVNSDYYAEASAGAYKRALKFGDIEGYCGKISNVYEEIK